MGGGGWHGEQWRARQPVQGVGVGHTSFIATESDLSTNVSVSGQSASPYSVKFTVVADQPACTAATRRAAMHTVAVLMAAQTH